MVKRSINTIIVLFATLVVTLALIGPTMDKILTDAVKYYTSEKAKDIKFQNSQERAKWLEEEIARQNAALGLDEPWYSPKRFTNTVLKVMVLDLGKSNFLTGDTGSTDVRQIILEKVPKTVLLFTTSTVIVSVLGVYLGAFMANRSGSIWDRLNTSFAVFSSSFPIWWFGMLMIFAFAVALHIFPIRSTPLTDPSDPTYLLDLLWHMVLPLTTIIILSIGSWAYFVRYFVVGILAEDYILAKRTSGIPERKILYSHALKNAAPPILTSITLGLAASFAGAVTAEAVFQWPGLGRLYYEAIGFMDIPVIIGITYVTTLIFVITVFITDIIYAYFDPRIKVTT